MQLLHRHPRDAALIDTLQLTAESTSPGPLEVTRFPLDQGAGANAVKWKHDPLSYESLGLLGLGSVLHCAVKQANEEKVMLLLEYGVDPDARDSNDETVLYVTTEMGDSGRKVLALLEAYPNCESLMTYELRIEYSLEGPTIGA